MVRPLIPIFHKYFLTSTTGFTYPLKSFLPHTSVPFVPLALLVSVLEVERVRTVLLAATATSTGRRRVPPAASSGHNSPVSAVVLPGSKRVWCVPESLEALTPRGSVGLGSGSRAPGVALTLQLLYTQVDVVLSPYRCRLSQNCSMSSRHAPGICYVFSRAFKCYLIAIRRALLHF